MNCNEFCDSEKWKPALFYASCFPSFDHTVINSSKDIKNTLSVGTFPKISVSYMSYCDMQLQGNVTLEDKSANVFAHEIR